MLCALPSRVGRIVPVPAAHGFALGDHPVETKVPWVARQRRVLLERVAQADQASRPGRTGEGSVVVATAAPYPRPGHVPGHERNEGQCPPHRRYLQLIAEGLRNAHYSGTQLGPGRVLGKADAIPAQTGKKNAFACCQRGVDQGTARHLVIGRGVGEDDVGRPELL